MSEQRIDRFLRLTAERGASDLHLAADRPPMMRVAGLIDVVRYRLLDESELEALLKPICRESSWNELMETGQCDFAYEVSGVARFRVNLFRQLHGLAAAFRIIPTQVITIEQLGLPQPVSLMSQYDSGIVLVTGPTGAGKSTTLAAIVDQINRTRAVNIITIEDPVEFVHDNRRAIIQHREVGRHTKSFATALKMSLREDPDIVLVGELRDASVIETALQAADSGMMVLGTLHTNSAAKTLDRILSAFPADRRDGISTSLSASLRAIVAQQLVRRKDGGRAAALEILFESAALRSAVREGKTYKIPDIIRSGRNKGMQTMDDALRELVVDGTVEAPAAFEKAVDKINMRTWMERSGYSLPEDVEMPSPASTPTPTPN